MQFSGKKSIPWILGHVNNFSLFSFPCNKQRYDSEIIIFYRLHTRPVHKNLYWNLQKCKAEICYILIDKQILERVFCSNIAPSLSSRNHIFYKAKYMGQGCVN